MNSEFIYQWVKGGSPQATQIQFGNSYLFFAKLNKLYWNVNQKRFN